MLKQNFEIILAFFASLTISLILIPSLKLIAHHMGLIDRPNARKVHQNPIPVIGGLVIGISLIMSLLVNSYLLEAVSSYFTIISASLLLMFVGILDDRLNLKAHHRLIIQLCCAYAIAASGIRLTSLYGVFGINELNVYVSYALTIFIITGVINAFNLIDGIDGLAGFLSLLGFSIFSYLLYIMGHYTLLIILMSLTGGIVGFLKYNLSAKKIFLGDGGSLLLGSLLVSSGVQIVELSSTNVHLDVNHSITIVFGIFLIPVFDSLRVYWGRMQRGFSPFRADKSHLHHLLIFFRISHKKASSIIALSTLALIIISFSFQTIGLNGSIIAVSLIFILLTGILSAIKNLLEWKNKIKKLENRD